jgi:hypothetical protein
MKYGAGVVGVPELISESRYGSGPLIMRLLAVPGPQNRMNFFVIADFFEMLKPCSVELKIKPNLNHILGGHMIFNNVR